MLKLKFLACPSGRSSAPVKVMKEVIRLSLTRSQRRIAPGVKDGERVQSHCQFLSKRLLSSLRPKVDVQRYVGKRKRSLMEWNPNSRGSQDLCLARIVGYSNKNWNTRISSKQDLTIRERNPACSSMPANSSAMSCIFSAILSALIGLEQLCHMQTWAWGRAAFAG